MKIFIKNNITIILTVVVSGILFSGITYAATYSFASGNVEHTKTDGTKTTVANALNDLYGLAAKAGSLKPELLGCVRDGTGSGTIKEDGIIIASAFAYVDHWGQTAVATLRVNNVDQTKYTFEDVYGTQSMRAWSIPVKAGDTWQLSFSPGGDITLRFVYGGCVFFCKN